MDPNDPLLKDEGLCSVRLHVGGLGPSVITEDLVKTFSSLGKVASVDIVRTKGRNFAYIDFHASSPLQVKRLFSLYNGCMWKGGRLKLEKAKELYMQKLHREWAEEKRLQEQDTENSQALDVAPIRAAPVVEKSEGFTIYFPSLRKVKKIPEKGLGKHKRSFERQEAFPCSLLQLCNCGGDCVVTSKTECNMKTDQSSFKEVKGQQAIAKRLRNTKEDRTSIRFEEDLRSTRSDVVDKSEEALPNTSIQVVETDTSNKLEDETRQSGSEVDTDTSKKPVQTRQEDKIKTAEDETETPKYTYSTPKKPTEDTSKESVKTPQEHKTDNSEDETETPDDASSTLKKPAETCPEKQIEEFEDEIDTTKDTGSTPKKRVKFDLDSGVSETKDPNSNTTGTNWVQKASWKALVGGTGRVSFSLTSILGENYSGSNKLTTDKEADNEKHSLLTTSETLTTDTNTNALSSWIDGSSSFPTSGVLKDQCKSAPAKKDDGKWSSGLLDRHQRTERTAANPAHGEREEKQTLLFNTQSRDDNVCSFMKSERSEQEWLEAKRAVKGIVKRSHKDALRSMKMFHKKQKY